MLSFADAIPAAMFVGKNDVLQSRWSNALQQGNTADRLVLARQIIRRADLQYDGAEPTRVTLPGLASGVSESLLVNHGFNVHSRQEEAFQVSVTPWKPSWLEEGTTDPSLEAIQRAERRSFKPAAGDPVLQAWGGHTGNTTETYLCEAQRDAVRSTLEAPPGSTLLVVMPTGSGKSLCAHLPALIDPDGLTVVVVPTVALALDQERAVGLRDTAYRAGAGGNATRLRDHIRQREQRIVFASPEAILTSLAPVLREAAGSGYLRHLVIDEAHIVDAWGDEFRPAFQDLAGFRQALLDTAPSPFQTLLLSATVTSETEATLKRLFGQPGPYASYFSVQLRPEPSYWIHRASSQADRTHHVLNAVHHLPRPLLLYVSTRDDVTDWRDRLRDAGYSRLAMVSGNTSANRREDVIDGWRSGSIDLVVATSAFGMGVDQQEVRTVVHACLPESIDRYYQEVGRAGRDGCASIALLCTAPTDIPTAESIARKRYISVKKGLRRWKAMFQSVNHLEDDTITVSLLESYDPAMSSRANVLWNQRTLLLMQRAGLIRVLGPPDWRRGETPSDKSDQLGEEKIATGSENATIEDLEQTYHDQRQRIQILEYRNREQTYWEGHVEPERQAAMHAVERSLDQMKMLMSTDRCVSHLLSSVYTLKGRSVARACGGCPACRNKKRTPFAHPLPLPPWPWNAPKVPEGLRGIGESPLYVFYDAEGNRGARRRRQRVLQTLVRRGACHVVGNSSLENRLSGLQGVRLYRSDTYDPIELPDLPTVHVVSVGNRVPEAVTYSGKPSWRLHLLPREAPDPRDPLRALRHMVDGITLPSLARRLGV